VPARYARFAYLEPRADPGSRVGPSPSMTLNRGEYRLSLVLRDAGPDEASLRELDRIKGVVLNTLVAARANRAYGGFCLPWLSHLAVVALPARRDVGVVAELRGEFGYKVGPATPYAEAG
jgi:hypothetical protein